MNKSTFLTIVALCALVAPAGAVTMSRRANVYGGGGPNGKCTIEVDVDGAAEIEINGDMGNLRTLSGQTAVWRRFECNGVLPRNPGDFRFTGVDGRGRQTLLRDPRQNGGRAVIRIDDPQGGREGYTFDIEWRGDRGGDWGGGPGGRPGGGRWDQHDDRRGPGGPGEPGRGPGGPGGRFTMARAIKICQDAVVGRIEQDGFRYVTFLNTEPDNNPGRNDWVTGTAEAKRGYRSARFQFACSVDFANGTVRSAEVNRR